MTGSIGARTVAACSAMAVSAGLVTACSSPPPPPHEPGAMVIVVGAHSNMPRPSLVADARTWVQDAMLSKDSLSIVSVSGTPSVVSTSRLSSSCDSVDTCDGAKKDFLQALDRRITNANVHAKSKEVDTLGAILLGARKLAEAKVSGPKQMIVIDSGLQTTGAMPLNTPGALSVDPAAIVAQLGADLEPLKGVRVMLTGIGATYDPQPPISLDARHRVQDIWTAVLKAGGAEVQTVSTDLANTAPAGGLPPVTQVNFNPPPPEPTKCVTLREDQICFRPNQAVYRDEAKATDVLRPVAEQFKSSGLTATVIGTTALDENPTTLSTARANRVIKSLVELGVPRRSLTAVGVGIHFAKFVPDLDARGQLIETLAIQNRLVIIQPNGASCA